MVCRTAAAERGSRAGVSANAHNVGTRRGLTAGPDIVGTLAPSTSGAPRQVAAVLTLWALVRSTPEPPAPDADPIAAQAGRRSRRPGRPRPAAGRCRTGWWLAALPLLRRDQRRPEHARARAVAGQPDPRARPHAREHVPEGHPRGRLEQPLARDRDAPAH